MTMPLSNETLQSHRKSVILHGITMAGLLVYVILVWIVQRSGTTGFLSGEPDPALRYFFYGGAVIIVFALRRIHNVLIQRAIHGHPKKSLNRLQKAALWTAILCEIPAVLGLIFFLLTGITRDFYFLAVLSLILFLMYFPKKNSWHKADQKIKAGRT